MTSNVAILKEIQRKEEVARQDKLRLQDQLDDNEAYREEQRRQKAAAKGGCVFVWVGVVHLCCCGELCKVQGGGDQHRQRWQSR